MSMSRFSTTTLDHGDTLMDEQYMRKFADTPTIQRRKEMLKRYPLPVHWQPPSTSLRLGRLRQGIFQTLCICAYGESNLDFLWESIKLAEEGDESVWAEEQKRRSEQQNNLLVLAGLLLVISAVFITTSPPDTSLLDHTRRGPYLLICGAFGILMGGIIVTLISILVSRKIRADHTENVFFANTLRVYCKLILLSYPSLSIVVAVLLLAFGLLVAVWSAKDMGFQFGGAVLLTLPLLMGGLFAIVITPVPHKEDTPGNEEGDSFLHV